MIGVLLRCSAVACVLKHVMHSKVLSAGTWGKLELGCGTSAIHKRAHHVKVMNLCHCFHMCGVATVASVPGCGCVSATHDETPTEERWDVVWKVTSSFLLRYLEVKSIYGDEKL